MKNHLNFALLALTAALSISESALAQDGYSSALLNQKGIFSRDGAEALAEPFRGVATTAGVTEGLFPVRSTGASTAAVQGAAAAFVASLNPMLLSRTQFPIDDPEWRNWSNVDVGIFARHGVSLEEMTAPQKDAAWELLTASLSPAGLDKTRRIIRTEQTLLELNGEPIRYGEEKYYFTIMGIPSGDEPWGWQLDGHHLVINFFVLGDQVVMSPAFWGGEPARAESGKYAGNIIMQQEQDQGLAFMQSLDAAQQARATLNTEKTRNAPMAAANADNAVLDYEGIAGKDLTSAQKIQLLDLARVYIGNLRDAHAAVTMEDISRHIDNTHFAWVGTTAADAVFYYRIHSPVILIEFDHQNPVGTMQINQPGVPTRDHIHSMVRTPNGNDYGKDYLRQHLVTHPH